MQTTNCNCGRRQHKACPSPRIQTAAEVGAVRGRHQRQGNSAPRVAGKGMQPAGKRRGRGGGTGTGSFSLAESDVVHRLRHLRVHSLALTPPAPPPSLSASRAAAATLCSPSRVPRLQHCRVPPSSELRAPRTPLSHPHPLALAAAALSRALAPWSVEHCEVGGASSLPGKAAGGGESGDLKRLTRTS
jgi:hypothetical protein